MSVLHYLVDYDRETESVGEKTQLPLSDQQIRAVLGLPANADLIGNFQVNDEHAGRLRRLGLTLDLERRIYYVEAEAPIEEVRATVERLQARKGTAKQVPTPSREKRRWEIRNYVSEESLDFALAHITRYYDTDFFPRAEEFLALSHCWDDVKQHLLSSQLDDVIGAAPLVEPWPKVRGGFRIVHRLDPLDALVYTALVREIASEVELSRAPADVACSYRYALSENSFFGPSSGHDVFIQRCEDLSREHSFVLSIDIADFYNSVYLHRLQNAIQLATDESVSVSKFIEQFLMTLNTGASQGIPVGPSASVVMAEVTLNDVDQFLVNKGVAHVRYVDDFRIFSNSMQNLTVLLQELVVYLHENQRLALNEGKTKVESTESFLSDLLGQDEVRRNQTLVDIEDTDPYGMDDDLETEDGVDPEELLPRKLQEVLEGASLDLGVARKVLRKGRVNRVLSLGELTITHLEFLAPVMNDVALYLDAITDAEFVSEHRDTLSRLCDSDVMGVRPVRLWMEWYFARHLSLLKIPRIRSFVFDSERLRPQAQAAIALRNEAWIKERKTRLLHYADWDRRSIILASAALAKDEREKWLRNLVRRSRLGFLDQCMVAWVLDGSPTSPQHGHEDDDPIMQ